MLCLAGHRVTLHNFLFSQRTCAQRRWIFSLFQDSSSNHHQNYHERKILPYRQGQLYELVADVGSYHRFVPFCIASRILDESRVDNTVDSTVTLEAELTVSFLGLEEKYTSKVKCRPYEMVQAVATAEIPLFKTLVTTWRFQPASATSPPHPTVDLASTLHSSNLPDNGGPTLLTLDLEYAFASVLHAKISDAFFTRVSKMMVKAFEERCIEVYGPWK